MVTQAWSFIGEVLQIESVDMAMFFDVASHPVVWSTLQILLYSSPVLSKFLHTLFLIIKEIFSDKRESKSNKDCNSVVALNFKTVGVKDPTVSDATLMLTLTFSICFLPQLHFNCSQQICLFLIPDPWLPLQFLFSCFKIQTPFQEYFFCPWKNTQGPIRNTWPGPNTSWPSHSGEPSTQISWPSHSGELTLTFRWAQHTDQLTLTFRWAQHTDQLTLTSRWSQHTDHFTMQCEGCAFRFLSTQHGTLHLFVNCCGSNHMLTWDAFSWFLCKFRFLKLQIMYTCVKTIKLMQNIYRITLQSFCPSWRNIFCLFYTEHWKHTLQNWSKKYNTSVWTWTSHSWRKFAYESSNLILTYLPAMFGGQQ